MSTTQNSIQYVIQGSVNGPTGFDGFEILLSDTSGQTDASVLNFIQAIENVVWPTGVTCSIQVLKVDQTVVSYNGDLTATPPAFD